MFEMSCNLLGRNSVWIKYLYTVWGRNDVKLESIPDDHVYNDARLYVLKQHNTFYFPFVTIQSHLFSPPPSDILPSHGYGLLKRQCVLIEMTINYLWPYIWFLINLRFASRLSYSFFKLNHRIWLKRHKTTLTSVATLSWPESWFEPSSCRNQGLFYILSENTIKICTLPWRPERR